eukprot:5924264-Pleurochrysis_carterae.AAC.1
MSEHAGQKSTSVTCVTEVGLLCSRNPRTRWQRSQYEWIETSVIQPAAERKGVRARTRQRCGSSETGMRIDGISSSASPLRRRTRPAQCGAEQRRWWQDNDEPHAKGDSVDRHESESEEHQECGGLA